MRSPEESIFNSELTTLAITLTIFDATATTMWLKLEWAREGNPLLVPLIERFGVVPAMLIRSVFGIIMVIVVDRLIPSTKWDEAGMRLLTSALGLLAAYHIIGPFI